MKQKIKAFFSETWDYYPQSKIIDRWRFIPPWVIKIAFFILVLFAISALVIGIVKPDALRN